MEIRRLTRINRALPVRHPPKGSYRAETRRARIPFLSVSARDLFPVPGFERFGARRGCEKQGWNGIVFL